ATWAPSARKTAPETKEASSEARKAATRPISLARPRRRQGSARAAAASSCSVAKLRSPGVSIQPGLITLTRTWCRASSFAIVGAVLGEGERAGLADPARGAGDERHPAVEAAHQPGSATGRSRKRQPTPITASKAA